MIVAAILILVAGFVLLAKGADFFVDGAAAAAQKLNVPGFLVGMTVIAMGTSLPECAVTITASIRGSNGMAISNVIGSNAFNLLVVCGACAVITPLAVKKSTLRREFPFSILVEAVLLVMSAVGMRVGHIDGILLLVIFVLFLLWMIRSTTKAVRAGEEAETAQIKELSNARCVVYILCGAAAIVVGGWLAVGAAEAIALRLGMSDTLVGLTICAIGTSLPELFTSVTAARKRQTAMALGNVIGSNIFNVLLVAGAATAISPIAINRNNLIDLIFVMAVSALFMLIVRRKQELRRAGGICLLALYALYLIYVCLRDTGVVVFLS